MVTKTVGYASMHASSSAHHINPALRLVGEYASDIGDSDSPDLASGEYSRQ